ncbi:conjugal transfer protein TraD [Shewanella khirikhana]|uniref:Conjugal transfer protein TraD n=1 Tax=Shewanella khirikhana TaxID=1965282 RepID=A0ABM7DXI3_9GAMM|nr:conjugal transfer protein TraD [Shewanella khirikhana]AZQ13286.1 hypothetical protein STH12_04260 [Shewanella khirikhana]
MSKNQPHITEQVKAKLLDSETPGFQAEFSPEEAEAIGAFEETALTESDALASVIDLEGNHD